MKIKKLQQGGNVAPAQEMPAQGQDPIEMLAQAAMAALESQDCQLSMEVCQNFLALIQQAMGGGTAPVGEVPEGEPMFAKGGKMVKRRKCKK